MKKVIIDYNNSHSTEILGIEIKFVEDQMKYHGITIDNIEKKKEIGITQWIDKRDDFVILDKIVEPELLTITYNKYFKT